MLPKMSIFWDGGRKVDPPGFLLWTVEWSITLLLQPVKLREMYMRNQNYKKFILNVQKPWVKNVINYKRDKDSKKKKKKKNIK